MWTDKKRYKGAIVSSSNVQYSGPDLTFIIDEDDQIKCDSNLNEVIKAIDTSLKALVDGNDFSEVDFDCYADDVQEILEENGEVTAKDLVQILFNKACIQKGQIEALQTQFNDWDITTEVIELDLGCLTPESADCEVAEHNYQLLTLFQIIFSKLCDHETRITDLE